MSDFYSTVINPQVTPISGTADAYLDWLVSEELDRQAKIREYRKFYYGEYGAPLTNRQKEYLNLQSSDVLNANFVMLVVDEVSRRLRISGFKTSADLKAINHWWRRNGMASKSIQLHRAAVRDGDSFLVVDWDNKRKQPRFTVNTAFDGHSGMAVRYDVDNRDIIYAVKRWSVENAQDGVVRRMNVYHPDRVERYISRPDKNRGDWYGYTEDGNPAVIPWVDGMGEPLGVPVFHFPYKAMDGPFGFSIVEPVIPLQIALNKVLADLLAAADASGFPIYVMLGNHPVDSDGEPLKLQPGGWISTSQPPNEVDVKTLTASDLRPIIDVLNEIKMTVAQVTETPIHMFQIQGQSPSEGSLRQQGVGLSARIEEAAAEFEYVWENALLFALELDYVFGDGSEPTPDIEIDLLWDDFDVLGREERIVMMSEAISNLVGAYVDLPSAMNLVQTGFKTVPPEDVKEREPQAIFGDMNGNNFEQPNGATPDAPTG